MLKHIDSIKLLDLSKFFFSHKTQITILYQTQAYDNSDNKRSMTIQSATTICCFMDDYCWQNNTITYVQIRDTNIELKEKHQHGT